MDYFCHLSGIRNYLSKRRSKFCSTTYLFACDKRTAIICPRFVSRSAFIAQLQVRSSICLSVHLASLHLHCHLHYMYHNQQLKFSVLEQQMDLYCLYQSACWLIQIPLRFYFYDSWRQSKWDILSSCSLAYTRVCRLSPCLYFADRFQ